MKYILVLLQVPFFAASILPARADSRMEDLRAKPPERWTPAKVYGLDVAFGGARLQGNVDHVSIRSELDFRYTFLERSNVFVEWDSDYGSYSGQTKMDKLQGSLLYAYALRPHLNLFLHTTHGRNKSLKLKYRTKNGFPGLCAHGFFKEIFDPFLASVSLLSEFESYEGGETRKTLRAGTRLNFGIPISDYATFGSDFYYIPKLADFGNYRIYWEGSLQFKLTPERLSFKITVSDEFESKPVVPGVRKNDFGLFYSVLLHLWK